MGWSQNGETFYTVEFGLYNISLYAITRQKVERITVLPLANIAFSPDRQQIAFVELNNSTKQGAEKVWASVSTLDLVSRQIRQVITISDPEGAFVERCISRLFWSPNSNQIGLIISDWRVAANIQNVLHLYNESDGSLIEAISIPLGEFDALFAPQWSSDGAYIAFILKSERKAEATKSPMGNLSTISTLYLLDIAQRQITLLATQVESPNWLPRSHSIAFVKSGFEIVIMDVSSKEIFNYLLDKPISTLVWSPDGKQIAYLTIGDSGIPQNLVILNIATGDKLSFSSSLAMLHPVALLWGPRCSI